MLRMRWMDFRQRVGGHIQFVLQCRVHSHASAGPVKTLSIFDELRLVVAGFFSARDQFGHWNPGMDRRRLKRLPVRVKDLVVFKAARAVAGPAGLSNLSGPLPGPRA